LTLWALLTLLTLLTLRPLTLLALLALLTLLTLLTLLLLLLLLHLLLLRACSLLLCFLELVSLLKDRHIFSGSPKLTIQRLGICLGKLP
jgi:hypothetical protein